MGSVIPASGMWLGNVLEIKHILSLVPNARDSRMWQDLKSLYFTESFTKSQWVWNPHGFVREPTYILCLSLSSSTSPSLSLSFLFSPSYHSFKQLGEHRQVSDTMIGVENTKVTKAWFLP